ncbi:MAG TPA: Holliday junction resolvase RuvX [Bacteroidota bacterium]|nr:Holliday junction resolvase RuvX [Bacteroidota bacterium]
MGGEPGRVMGIDYGRRRVGVALTDPLRVLTRGAGTIANGPGLLDALGAIIRDEEVVRIVVGMPYAPDGGLGAMGAEVQDFITALRTAAGIPVVTWDESFTSAKAQRSFIETGMKKKHRRQKGRIDEMAARLLLQDYLENGHQH